MNIGYHCEIKLSDILLSMDRYNKYKKDYIEGSKNDEKTMDLICFTA